MLNKRYKDNDQDDYVPSYDEIVHDSDDDLDVDEKNVKKQEEFEHKFNLRSLMRTSSIGIPGDEKRRIENAEKHEKERDYGKTTGNDEMEIDEEDVEGDFDQKRKEMLSNYDGNIAVEDEEKPTFSDIDDEDYDEEDYVEDWDNWTGGGGGANAEELNCEDEGFNMDCDFQLEVIEFQ